MTVRLPGRAGEAIAVTCAVTVGAALVTLCSVLAETGLRSPVPAQRFAGVDVVIGGDQIVTRDEDFDLALPDPVGVPMELVRTVSEIAGVRAAAADFTFPAALPDGEGGVVPGGSVRHNGHGWGSLLGSVDVTGAPPAGPDDVVLATDLAALAGVSVGDPVQLILRGQPRDMLVTGIADLDGGGIFVGDTLARDLSHRSRDTVDLLSVEFDADVDSSAVRERIEKTVADRNLVVATGDGIGRLERPAAAAASATLLAASTSVAGVLVTLVGFITAGAVSVGVANRARELALLRAVGATPKQIRSMTARRTTRGALGGVLVGITAGSLLSAAATGPLVAMGLLVPGQSLSWSPVPALGTGLLTLGLVQVAACAGSFRISRMSGVDAITATETEPASASPIRTGVGFVVIALSATSTVIPLVTRGEAALIGAASGTLLAIIGVSLVAPAAVTRSCEWLASRASPPSSWLAVRNSGSRAVRTGGAISVLALAIGLSTTQLFAESTMSATIDHEVEEGTFADLLVSAPEVGGVSAEALDTIEAAPSVTAAVPVIRSTVTRRFQSDDRTRAESYPVSAVGSGFDGVLDLGIVDGDLSRLNGASVAVDSATSRMAGIDVGDTLPLILSDGAAVEPTVVATYSRGVGFGTVVMPLDLLPQAATGPYDAVFVNGDEASVATELADLVAGSPGLRIEETRTTAAGAVSQDPTRPLSVALSVVLMGYVLIDVANRLVVTTLRRRREWQLLRAVGATPRQLLAMAGTEGLFVCLGAVVTGLVISLVPMTVVAIGFVGRPWPQGPLWPVLATVSVVCVVALLTMMLPAHHLLRGSGVPVPEG
ncbi:FtsX-like permease family protein [Rhodococcus sp. SJ-2]